MALALLIGTGLAPADGAEELGRLVVRVQDLSGGTLPDAAVVIESSGGGLPSASRTGRPDTVFELPMQATYTVRVTLAGFAPQFSEGIVLRAGAVKRVVFVMRKQAVETVQVRASIEDPSEGRTSLSFDALDDLPIQGRSYQNALSLAPGVVDPNHDGNPNVNGARERDFRASVDGLANVDPLTGFYQSEVNPDSVAELEIVTTGASAENGGAVGGFARIVTKEGSNTLTGSLGVYWRSSTLDRLGPSYNVPSYDDIRPTFSLTGPIVKDRLYFALFHELIDKGQPVDVPEYKLNKRTFVNGERAEISTGGRYVIDSKGTRSLDKLTWQVSDRNKMSVQFAADPLTTGPLGIGERAIESSSYELGQGGATLQAQWSFQGSSNFFVQTTLGESRTSVSYRPTTQDVKNFCPLDGWPTRRVDVYGRNGGQPLDEDYCLGVGVRSGSYFRDYSDHRKRDTLKSDMSYYVANLLGTSHTLRAGLIAESRTYEAEQSLRSTSTWTEFPPSLATDPGDGVIHRQVYVPGYPDFENNTAEGTSYGFYLEDLFTINRFLTIRAGARVDQENLVADGFEPFDPANEEKRYRKFYAQCALSPIPGNIDRCVRSGWHYFHRYEVVPALAASEIRGILDTGNELPRAPERFRISNTNVSPRLSVTIDPGTNGIVKLFGTAGRYFGETFLAVPSFEQGPDNFLYTYPVEGEMFDCRPTPAGPYTFTCRHISIIPPDTSATVALASIHQVDRNLRTPHQDEYTGGFSAEVLPETSVTASYIHRDYRDQLQDTDLNHYIVSPGAAGGLPLESVHNPFFNEVLRVGNLNASTYRAWQLEIHRRFHRNWEVEASWVHSRAEGNGEDYNQSLGNDPGLSENELGYLSYDMRDVVKVNARAQIPRWNVRVSTALSYQSGTPYSVRFGQFQPDLPQRFGNVTIGYGRMRTVYPTGARNDQRNLGYYNVDLGFRKDFAVKSAALTLSLDVFNAINDRTLVVTDTSNGAEGVFRTGRQFQLGMKTVF